MAVVTAHVRHSQGIELIWNWIHTQMITRITTTVKLQTLVLTVYKVFPLNGPAQLLPEPYLWDHEGAKIAFSEAYYNAHAVATDYQKSCMDDVVAAMHIDHYPGAELRRLYESGKAASY